tara:strand:+ start:390 stop:557 length:168 start_codon:yes stop_codon:yes gene_type:complete
LSNETNANIALIDAIKKELSENKRSDITVLVINNSIEENLIEKRIYQLIEASLSY